MACIDTTLAALPGNFVTILSQFRTRLDDAYFALTVGNNALATEKLSEVRYACAKMIDDVDVLYEPVTMRAPEELPIRAMLLKDKAHDFFREAVKGLKPGTGSSVLADNEWCRLVIWTIFDETHVLLSTYGN
jgi:hypothetical protein